MTLNGLLSEFSRVNTFDPNIPTLQSFTNIRGESVDK